MTGAFPNGSKEEISLTSSMEPSIGRESEIDCLNPTSTKWAAGADHRVECGYDPAWNRITQQVAEVSRWMDGWMGPTPPAYWETVLSFPLQNGLRVRSLGALCSPTGSA